MTNTAIAATFQRLADLLEIEGENPFKLRAYRSAAETIAGLTEDLESVAARDELETLPGVGKAIAAKIGELCATGRMRAYEEARTRTPETLLELLALPGIGPRKAQALHRQLEIRTLDDLQAAADTGRLREVAGFGTQSGESIRAAIAAYRRRSSRWPIYRALPYAETLAAALRETAGVERVEIAGSVRRMRETTGNINLVAAGDTAATTGAFLALPDVAEVLDRRADSAAARTQTGALVSLRVAPPGAFGAVFLAATGSAAHQAALAGRAAAQGMGTASGGEFTGAGGQAVPGEEEEVYGLLGLPWIPPELREGRGEVEAAGGAGLPRLITAEDMGGILHCHSLWSDGRASIAEMAAAARALGHRFVAITDHSRSLGVARGMDEERLRAQMAEVDRLNAGSTDRFRILKGLECDILADGTLDLPEAILHELDLVIGSVHSYFKQDEATMTARILRAMESGCVDIIAHPTGRLLGGRDPYAVDVPQLIAAAAELGVALEINADPHRLDLDDENARAAAAAGVPISINTDAHQPATLGSLLYGIATARRAWLEPRQVINTWPAEELWEWLARPRGGAAA